MSAHPPVTVTKLENFSSIWNAFHTCDKRGLHIYNPLTRSFDYSSFNAIYAEARCVATALKTFNFQAGDSILLSAKTSRYMPPLWLAMIMIGATPVPMPPKESLVGKNNFYNRLKETIPLFSSYVCFQEEVEDIQRAAGDSGQEMRTVLISDLFAQAEQSAPIDSHETPSGSNTAFIQFTSGSTSKPKGILVTYDNLLSNISTIWTRLNVNPETLPAASWLPLYHDMGLVGFFLGCLFTQTELFLMSSIQFARRPFLFLSLLSERRIEICGMPNFALEWIVRRYNPEKEYDFDFSPLKWIGIGAEPINPDTVKLFYDEFNRYGLKPGALSPCYGLAEATLAVTIAQPLTEHIVVEKMGARFPTTGRVLDGTEVKLLEPVDGVGTIAIKGPSVVQKALIKGQETVLPDRQGFYNTGDIGFFHDDRLVIMGRNDEMFIVNGENVFPYEIETAVRRLGGASRNRVACFALSGKEHEHEYPDVIILFESTATDEECRQLQEEIQKCIRREIGVPIAGIVPVPVKSIPITPSGKIKRTKAKQMYLNGEFSHFAERKDEKE